MEIWHNPRCSKSRGAITALTEAGVEYVERRYLDDPPSADELERVLDKLGVEPWDLARLKDPLAGELGLADLPRDRAAWIAVLAENPALIERPVIITEERAVIGRTPAALEWIIS